MPHKKPFSVQIFPSIDEGWKFDWKIVDSADFTGTEPASMNKHETISMEIGERQIPQFETFLFNQDVLKEKIISHLADENLAELNVLKTLSLDDIKALMQEATQLNEHIEVAGSELSSAISGISLTKHLYDDDFHFFG